MAKINQSWVLGLIVVFFAALYFLGPILTPFVVGTLVAYIGDPLVNRLSRWKIPRSCGALLVFILFFLGVTGLAFLLIPIIITQVETLIKNIPDMMATVTPWLKTHGVDLTAVDRNSIQIFVTDHLTPLKTAAGGVFKVFRDSSHVMAVVLVNMILILLVGFYFMRDWPWLLNRVDQLIPINMRATAERLAQDCDRVLGAFLRGQLFVMVALAVYYSIALSLVGFNFAVLIGVLIGLFSIVPFLGTVMSFVLAGLAVAFQFHGLVQVLIVLGIIGFGHILENFILVPWLIGNRVGLHPVAVVFSVLAGGELFGVTGVLVAVPLAAVLLVFLREILARYKSSRLFSQGPSE